MTPIYKKAYFAGGCFWGVEYHFELYNGVRTAINGYMGGNILQPTYEEVSLGNTGHYETVEVTYNENIVSFDELAMHFFEIHDFTQINGQGDDIGLQYMSAIFYSNEDEKYICEDIFIELKRKDYKTVTKLIDANEHSFYKAENFHQNYYLNKFQKPYCHKYKKIF